MKTAIAGLCFAFACGAACAADPARDRIDADYKAARAQCSKIPDRKERKVCDADAKGRRKVALAELKSDAKKGDWQKEDLARQNAIGADSDAKYAAAKEHCKQLSGDAKDRCVADAKKKFNKG
jgi:hypothetical protein